jgi:hypothetical protein
MAPIWLPTQITKVKVHEENDTVAPPLAFGQIQSQLLKNEAGQPMTIQNVGFTITLQFHNQTAELVPREGTQWYDHGLLTQWVTCSEPGRFAQ